MQTIKTYLTNLPKVVKIILLINLLFYILTLTSSIAFNFDINHYLAFHPTHTNKFQINQLFTFMFTHDYNPTHIVVNLTLLLLFSISFAKKFGFKNYILMYVFSSIVGVLCYNGLVGHQNNIYKKVLLEKNIQTKSHDIGDLSHSYNKLIHHYNETFFSAIGSSGAVCGFIISFMLLNVTSVKKNKILILYITSFFIIYYISIPFINNKFYEFETQIGHVGGILGGVIFTLVLKTKKRID